MNTLGGEGYRRNLTSSIAKQFSTRNLDIVEDGKSPQVSSAEQCAVMVQAAWRAKLSRLHVRRLLQDRRCQDDAIAHF
ncbi:unnamed protein product, partial [Chrysoparadoxa australica]